MPDVTDANAGVPGNVAQIAKDDRTNATRRGSEPVFVDTTGRRRRLLAVAGGAGGVALLLVVLTLLAGFTGVGPGGLGLLTGTPLAALVTQPAGHRLGTRPGPLLGWGTTMAVIAVAVTVVLPSRPGRTR